MDSSRQVGQDGNLSKPVTGGHGGDGDVELYHLIRSSLVKSGIRSFFKCRLLRLLINPEGFSVARYTISNSINVLLSSGRNSPSKIPSIIAAPINVAK